MRSTCLSVVTTVLVTRTCPACRERTYLDVPTTENGSRRHRGRDTSPLCRDKGEKSVLMKKISVKKAFYYDRDARAGLRVRVLHRLTTYQIYRSNFVVLGFERPMSLSTRSGVNLKGMRAIFFLSRRQIFSSGRAKLYKTVDC